MAVAHVPSAPAPYTSALPPGGGEWRVTECSETANGSAITATSSEMESGIGMNMRVMGRQKLGEATGRVAESPVCMPAARRPWRKL